MSHFKHSIQIRNEVNVAFTSSFIMITSFHLCLKLTKNQGDQDDLRSCQQKISLWKMNMKFKHRQFHIII